MTKRAQLPDGTVLEFPDETPDAVMDRAVRSHLSSAKPDFGNVQASSSETVPERPPVKDSIGRQVGLGARAMMRGAYSLPGIVLDPVAGIVNHFGGNMANSAEAADMHANALGLPQPVNAAERVSGDITAGVTGGAGWVGAGRQLAARAPGVTQRVGESLASMPGTQLAGAAIGSGAAGTTREQGGGKVAQIVAGLAGGLSPAAIKTGTAAGVRGAMRGGEAGRQAVDEGRRNFFAVGATPSVGQATGNARMQGVESLLGAAPTSQGVMTRAAERQAEQIGQGLQNTAEGLYRNASAERAGRAIEAGVQTFANNVNAMRKGLYWVADKHIPDTTTLPLTNTQSTLARLTTPAAGAESTTAAMVNPKIAGLAKTIGEDLLAARANNTGGIPYSAVKDIRSRIGEALSDFSLTTDKPTAEYKALYAALSQDMEAAARALGPEAMRAAKRANNYFKASADRLTQLERVVDKAGGPERVYSAVMAGTQDGGTTLRAVMQSLPKESQRALTAAVVKRMGLATKGNQGADGDIFSAQTFLTNWNKVSPEAKRALFDRHGPKFVDNMERVAKVAERIKDGSKVFANPSGTTNRAAALTYGATLAGSLLTGNLPAFAGLAGGGASSNVLARAMTSPRFVDWLAKATEMPVSSLPQQILVLQRIGADDQDVAELADALQEGQQH